MDNSKNVFYSKGFYDIHVDTSDSHESLVSLVIDIVKPKTVVDIGCSVGAALLHFKAQGVLEVLGVDGYWLDEGQLLIDRDEFMRHDFNTGALILAKKYDLAISTEVAEHVYDANADDFITSLVNASDVILFSAAIPGQHGTNHVNEQWPQYWIDKFMRHDYIVSDCIRELLWDDESVSHHYRQNTFLFYKKTRESTLCIPKSTPLRYNMVHPKEYTNKIFQLFGLFSDLYRDKNYDSIIELAFLRDYDISANLFLGLVYFEKGNDEKCIKCLETFMELSGIGYGFASLIDVASSTLTKSTMRRELHGLMSETEHYIKQLNDLSPQTAKELYEMLNEAEVMASTHIGEADKELCVMIRERRDLVYTLINK